MYIKALGSGDAGKANVDHSKEALADPVEPTIQGAVLLQSMLRLPEPHNQLVIRR